MAFNWEQSAFLGYMVEQYEKQQQDFSNWDDEDTEDEESNDNDLPWWER
jgi:hypothetical protein